MTCQPHILAGWRGPPDRYRPSVASVGGRRRDQL